MELQTHNKNKAPKPSIGFLDLPAEIRNKIYNLALINDQQDDSAHPIDGCEDNELDYDKRTRSNLFQPALLATSKQIRAEALPIYYASNQFYVSIDIENTLPIALTTVPGKALTCPKLLTGSTDLAAHDLKAALDNFMRPFTCDNGVDGSSRLAYVREVKIKIEYRYASDGWLTRGTWDGYMSAYSKWASKAEGEDAEELEEVEEEDHEEKGKTVVVVRRKKVHRHIRNAERIRNVQGAKGKRYGHGWGNYRNGPEGSLPPECYGLDALLWFAKFCPLATKSVLAEKEISTI